MIDAMMPILRELYEARDEATVADCVLRMPDAVVLKFQKPIEKACQNNGFARGAEFVALRVSLMQAVRNSAGGLPGGPSMTLAGLAAELAAIARAGGVGVPPATLQVRPEALDI